MHRLIREKFMGLFDRRWIAPTLDRADIPDLAADIQKIITVQRHPHRSL